jgi:Mce-associated membrane protein
VTATTGIEGSETTGPAEADTVAGDTSGRSWLRIVTHAVLPALIVVSALGAGYLKWMDGTADAVDRARVESVQAATDITIAMLSYQPDTVEEDLGAARDRMTGEFRDSYTSLTNDVVIPGAREKRISTVATVPAAASVQASTDHAVVVVFVNQATTVGDDVPTDTASTVRVTLEKVDDQWLMSGFEPI